MGDIFHQAHRLTDLSNLAILSNCFQHLSPRLGINNVKWHRIFKNCFSNPFTCIFSSFLLPMLIKSSLHFLTLPIIFRLCLCVHMSIHWSFVATLLLLENKQLLLPITTSSLSIYSFCSFASFDNLFVSNVVRALAFTSSGTFVQGKQFPLSCAKCCLRRLIPQLTL